MAYDASGQSTERLFGRQVFTGTGAVDMTRDVGSREGQ